MTDSAGLPPAEMPSLNENDRPLAEVSVSLGDRGYEIEIGARWLDAMIARMARSLYPRKVAVVTEAGIARHWLPYVVRSMERVGYQVTPIEIPGGERNKNFATAGTIIDRMLRQRFTRGAGLVALGGGIVGDIAGFAAAATLRGIDYVQLPTTLLAMVDSSVGGKTGVNHEMGKNLIGAFWQPVFVGIELEFLATLPEIELRCGLAEVIKAGILADGDFFAWLEENLDRALARDPATLAHIVRRSCEIKAAVVIADERETSGARATLNLGHTFAHAAEALGAYGELRHGEAVGMGMVAAARMAADRDLISERDRARIERLVQRAGLPTRMLHALPEEYWLTMKSDKKASDDCVRFILPTRIGRVEMFEDVTRSELVACLEKSMGQPGKPRPRPLDLA